MIEVLVPIKTQRGQNNREHHFARHRRVKAERGAACRLTKSALWGRENLSAADYALKIRVTITRISSGTLDGHDNLRGAVKAIVDGVADAFNRKDDDPYFTWEYAQEKCKRGYFGVRIQIEPATRNL